MLLSPNQSLRCEGLSHGTSHVVKIVPGQTQFCQASLQCLAGLGSHSFQTSTTSIGQGVGAAARVAPGGKGAFKRVGHTAMLFKWTAAAQWQLSDL